MFASNGNTNETRISTPATGQDKAWRKAAAVTIIAAMLPRRSRGLEVIGANTGKASGIRPVQNGIVTGRAPARGYGILLSQQFFLDRVR